MPENTLSARIKFGIIIIIIIIIEIGVVSSSAQALQFREATQTRLEFSQSQRGPGPEMVSGFSYLPPPKWYHPGPSEVAPFSTKASRFEREVGLLFCVAQNENGPADRAVTRTNLLSEWLLSQISGLQNFGAL